MILCQIMLYYFYRVLPMKKLSIITLLILLSINAFAVGDKIGFRTGTYKTVAIENSVEDGGYELTFNLDYKPDGYAKYVGMEIAYYDAGPGGSGVRLSQVFDPFAYLVGSSVTDLKAGITYDGSFGFAFESFEIGLPLGESGLILTFALNSYFDPSFKDENGEEKLGITYSFLCGLSLDLDYL